ncbi:AAA-like domain-containing protein [Anaerolineales bacterium HSG6]|nr:AAA-like domain-containing protein [Anaerolineales bacterium HSG6]MDM8531913.1 AAA-like domain-containing protein [Anaerolineales bacterium HSG25]
MRTFSSYEQVNTKVNYYVPREELVTLGYNQLLGDDPSYSGHYLTVWAPRQTGKSWIMRQIVRRIMAHDGFEVAMVTLQSTKTAKTEQDVLNLFVEKLQKAFDKPFPKLTSWQEMENLFSSTYFDKPVILILDEFDSMAEIYINNFVNEFRNMYGGRMNEQDKQSSDKDCLLHGLALVGVRAVLGIESRSGSPFNIQRSLHVPNLTFAEVESMYQWYERESGQPVEAEIIEQVYEVTHGQPGLVSWFGELLTQSYNPGPDKPIDEQTWRLVWLKARFVEPNNTIMNLIAKARYPEYSRVLTDLFSQSNIPFSFDNPRHNYLYMNGIISTETIEQTNGELAEICRFSSSFIQTRIYHALKTDLVNQTRLPLALEVGDDLADVFDSTKPNLDLPALLKRYKDYLVRLKEAGHNPWKEQPRRKTDLQLTEAVGHFHLYAWLKEAIGDLCIVSPEFPTGNGKVDLHIRYQQKQSIIELKSFKNVAVLKQDQLKAADYATSLGLDNITLAVFVPVLDETVLAKLSGSNMVQGVAVTVVAIGWV